MKKIVCLFLVLILIFLSSGTGFVLPVKIVHAETLSTSIFPSTIGGMQIIKSAVQSPHSCWAGIAGYGAQEFVVAAYQYESGTSAKTLEINVGKYNTSGSAENIAKSCAAEMKAMAGTSTSWGGVRDITVLGYKAIYDTGSDVQGNYGGIIFVVVNEYLISMKLISTSYVSESDLANAASVIVLRIPQAAPSLKNDGEYCSSGSQCRSGHCYNSVCCASGKDCCTENSHCEEFFSCDRSVYYCTQKKVKGSSCQLDSDCQTNYCGYAGGSKICCTKGPIGACCTTQSHCGGTEYCFDYGCKARESDGAQCGYDYQCRSDYCEGGKCKTRPRETAKFSLGRFCKSSSQCESKNCSNGICCEKGKDCCSLTQECKEDNDEWWRCIGGKCQEDVEGRQNYEEAKKRKDGYCAPDEKCYTPDCEYTIRCGINEACSWGGERERACIGCLASIVSELNIVYKAVDILQGVGCDVFGNLISGLLSAGQEAMDKIYSAFVSIIFVAIDLGMELSKTAALLLKIIACIDGQFGIGKTVLLHVGYALTEVASSVSGNKTAMVALESPAGLIVKDSKGNVTGKDSLGITYNNVSDSVFVEFPKSDFKLVFLTDTGGDKYEVITRATAAGTINVKTARSDGETIEKIDFNNITQDSETQTDLDFKTKVGSGTVNMEIPLKEGGAWFRTGQLSTEKIDETKIPDKFKAKESFMLKILKILIILVILAFGVVLFRKKRESILKFLKKQKEKLAKKSGAKKPAEPGSRKSIIVNIIKLIVCWNIAGFGVVGFVSIISVYSSSFNKMFWGTIFFLAALLGLYLCYKIIKSRKLKIKHIIIAFLLNAALGIIAWLLLSIVGMYRVI